MGWEEREREGGVTVSGSRIFADRLDLRILTVSLG